MKTQHWARAVAGWATRRLAASTSDRLAAGCTSGWRGGGLAAATGVFWWTTV